MVVMNDAEAHSIMTILKAAAAAIAALTMTAPVLADMPDFKFGGRGGTLGYGLEAGVQPHKRVVVRASITQAQVNLSETFDDIDYDLTLDLGAAGVQLDVYPLFGGIYVTGGVFSNDNTVDLTATPSEGIEIGSTTYTPEEVGTLVGAVTFEDVATYLGLGWTVNFAVLPFESFIEAGAYFQGAPDVSYVATGLLAADPDFLADLDAEATQVEEDLSMLEVYPKLNVGLRFSF